MGICVFAKVWMLNKTTVNQKAFEAKTGQAALRKNINSYFHSTNFCVFHFPLCGA